MKPDESIIHVAKLSLQISGNGNTGWLELLLLWLFGGFFCAKQHNLPDSPETSLPNLLNFF